MGKDGFLTPKAIANKIKAKGLQKLRWYCQMCQKQCRDENGFKCHLKSESHLRQMSIFGENANKFVEGYSQEFEKSFLQHFRTAHRHTRMHANVLYNEFIADRDHVHMNSTKWLSLTEFVTHLGRTGKCKVEETPKGWFITLIQKDKEEQLRDQMKEKRKRAEEADEIRHARELEQQVARANKLAKKLSQKQGRREEEVAEGELVRDKLQGPLEFQLTASGRVGGGGAKAGAAQQGRPAARNVFDKAAIAAGSKEDESSVPVKTKKVRSALEEMMEREEAEKEKKARSKSWLLEGIVVKIMSKELKKEGFFKEKARVKKVILRGGRALAEVEHLKSGAVLRVDQAQLETVIPKTGGEVLIVKGPHKGHKAVLLRIDSERFQAQVEVIEGAGGSHDDKRSLWVEYDDISKYI